MVWRKIDRAALWWKGMRSWGDCGRRTRRQEFENIIPSIFSISLATSTDIQILIHGKPTTKWANETSVSIQLRIGFHWPIRVTDLPSDANTHDICLIKVKIYHLSWGFLLCCVWFLVDGYKRHRWAMDRRVARSWEGVVQKMADQPHLTGATQTLLVTVLWSLAGINIDRGFYLTWKVIIPPLRLRKVENGHSTFMWLPLCQISQRVHAS